MSLINYFSVKDIRRPPRLMFWDVIVFIFMVVVFLWLTTAASDMVVSYEIGDPIEISLSPFSLPYYAMRTVLRMFIALFFSLLFAFVFGSMAAKNPSCEKVIIPAVDVLQSIPVIGFLEISFVWFLYAFKGSFLGPEVASIFAVFVSQVWNLILSYYQSLKTMPKDFDEVMHIYRLSGWQRFFRLEVPFAAPGLIWNSMLSLSAGWFFVVAGEAITIANHNVSLPGIGSYIATATEQGDYYAIYAAIGCLFVVIMLYDQLLFRPLNYWLISRNNPEVASRPSWILGVLSQSFIVYVVARLWEKASKRMHLHLPRRFVFRYEARALSYVLKWLYLALWFLFYGVLIYIVYDAANIIHAIPLAEIKLAMLLGAYTAARVFILVLLCCVIWFPVGIYLGLNARVSDIMQPVIQFLAAFPPNMLYPLFGSIIIYGGYNPDIWLSPLIILGTQWYILFNIIAGVRALPGDLLLMASSLNLSKWRYYQRVIIPGVLPSLMTGVVTAAGGAWNTSIVAEAVSWKGQDIYAQGLGAYIMKASRLAQGDKVCLGVVVMCFYVLLINKVVWMPLYNLISKRYGGNNA